MPEPQNSAVASGASRESVLAGNRWAEISLAALKAHAPFLAITGFYWLLLQVIVFSRPDHVAAPFGLVVSGMIGLALTLTLVVVAGQRFYVMVVHTRPDDPIKAYSRDMARTLFDARRWATGLPMSAVFLTFMYVYATFKYNIHILQPYSWDQTFEAWDRALHFGYQPFEVLGPLFGSKFATYLLDANYLIWALFVWGTCVYLGFSGRHEVLRTRFFLSYMLTWSIGGTLLAVMMSSAGPCFWTSLGLPGDPYQSLMHALKAADATYPVKALLLQDQLWQSYVGTGTIAGISAMPSMHNAMALLLALSLSQVNRKLGWLMWAHCALVYVGSVMLAWHYAVDAFIAFGVTWASWRLSAPFAAWWHAQEMSTEFKDILDRELPRA